MAKDPIPAPDAPVYGELTADFGGTSDLVSIRCVCGYETSSIEEALRHLQVHGATVVTVTPENRRARPR